MSLLDHPGGGFADHSPMSVFASLMDICERFVRSRSPEQRQSAKGLSQYVWRTSVDEKR